MRASLVVLCGASLWAIACAGRHEPPAPIDAPVFDCPTPHDAFDFAPPAEANTTTTWRVDRVLLENEVATLQLTQPSVGSSMEVTYAVPSVAPALPDVDDLLLLTAADNFCAFDGCRVGYQRLTDAAGAPYIEGGTVEHFDDASGPLPAAMAVPFDVNRELLSPCLRERSGAAENTFARARVDATDTRDTYAVAPGDDRVLTFASGVYRLIAVDAYVETARFDDCDGCPRGEHEFAGARAYLYRIAQ